MIKTIGDLGGVIEHLKSRISITDVVGEAVHLQSAGNSDVHKGVCCFHNEKTPSLIVTKSKGLYHCFGCKAGGDIVTFYKEYHKYNTMEAIYLLAETYNIDISSYERELTEEEKKRMKMLAVNKKVAQGLHDKLMQANHRGYDYLMGERGVTEETMVKFTLGYCESLRDIYTILKDEDPNLISTLDLDNDLMFTDAIVYPLILPNGDVVGFKTRPYHGGRVVDEKGAKLPKYVGTSNKSPLYTNSVLFGLNIARKSNSKSIILVEGQHDVTGLHQVGFDNVAGSEGSSLTEQNLKLLEEYGIREIVILYDGDHAGREASLAIAKKASEIKTSMSIKIARITDGYDPDSFALERGKLGLIEILGKSVYSNQYVIDIIAESIDISGVTGKIDFIKRAQDVILNASSHEEIFLIQYVAEIIGVRADIVEDMVREERAKNTRSLLYNLDGEKIILSGMIRNKDFRIEAMSSLRSDDWYIYKHQVLFDIIVSMENESIDVNAHTLKAMINNSGHNSTFNSGAFIDELMITLGDYQTLIDDMLDKSHRRKIIKRADDLKKSAEDFKNKMPLVIEEHIERVVSVVESQSTEGVAKPQDGAKHFMETLVDRMTNPNQIVGIPLGDRFKTMTSILNGIMSKKLITISANQSVGKTTILCNMLEEICVTQKKKWVHFTLEMTKEEIVTKIIGIRAGVNTQKIERGNLTDEEFARVRQATIDYHEGGLIVYDDKVTLESIMNEVRVLQRREDIAGVSIDYIQLMMLEGNKNKQRYEELGDISGALKNTMAKKMNLPVIILSQLNRDALKQDVATAESGSGSYKIAQDSDIYITLKEKSAEEIEQWGIEKGNLIMNIDKNRGGRADVLLDIVFQKDVQIMKEVA